MGQDLMDAIPPHSKEAEQVVLAAALRSPEYRVEIIAEVQKSDFYFDAHQKFYDAMQTLESKGQPSDPAAVYQLLLERNQAEDIGLTYIGQVWTDWAGHKESIARWQHFAEIVREKAKARRVIHVCNEAIRDAYSPVGPMDELVGDTEKKLFSIATGTGFGSDPVSLTTAKRRAIENIDARMKGSGEKPSSTGFESLDQILGGFWNGDLTILAARPSVGKTALALAFAIHTIEHSPSLFFSMEMRAEEIANRSLAFQASVPLNAIRGSKNFEPGEYESVVAAQRNTPCELWIDDRSHLSANEITRVVRREMRRRNVRLVIIDYLQRMSHPKGDNYARQVGETAKSLKTLARDCNVPVICLAQLNRDSETVDKGEPKLSHLRDSGEIEQEADNVIMLHPGPQSSYDTSVQSVKALVVKQRNGPKATAELTLRRPYTRFE